MASALTDLLAVVPVPLRYVLELLPADVLRFTLERPALALVLYLDE